VSPLLEKLLLSLDDQTTIIEIKALRRSKGEPKCSFNIEGSDTATSTTTTAELSDNNHKIERKEKNKNKRTNSKEGRKEGRCHLFWTRGN